MTDDFFLHNAMNNYDNNLIIEVPNSCIYKINTYPGYHDFTPSQLYRKYFNIVYDSEKHTYDVPPMYHGHNPFDVDIDYRTLETFVYTHRHDYIQTIDKIYGINITDDDIIHNELCRCLDLSEKQPWIHFSTSSIYYRNIENIDTNRYKIRLFNYLMNFKCKSWLDQNYESFIIED